MRHIPRPARIAQYLAGSAARVVLFPVRMALLRYARAAPAPAETAGASRSVVILLANAWGMGGTIRTVHNLAGHLATSHEVEIISIIRRRERPFFEFPAGVTVTTLRDLRPGAGSRKGLLRFLERCPSVLMHPADSRADHFTLLTDLDLVRRLRGRAGALIATRPGLNLIAAELQAPGLATIGQEHLHLNAHPGVLLRAMKRSYPKLDALVALTKADARDYERLLGEARPRIEHVPNAARDLGAARPDLDARVVLGAGRLNRQKGFDLLVSAFARVAPSHRDWRLRICGQGQEREELERLVAEQGLQGIAKLPGPRDLGEEIGKASVFVLSSRFEGFPLVLLEAMSVGMAVVSFDCPTGPRDLVEDGRNGLLVPANDVEALAAAIARMMDDEELRRRCAAAAPGSVRAYSAEAVGRRWEELLSEVAR